MKLIYLAFSLVSFNQLAAQGLPDPAIFDRVLEAYRSDGLVDYAGLKSDRSDLDRYLAELAGADGAVLDSASRSTRFAFWINAYNACTLGRVIDHYPIEKRGLAAGLVNKIKGIPDNSIRQIPEAFTGEFCRVAGKVRSLDEIEHKILRPMGDPRIHFAINCAARSCPRLGPASYRAESLDEVLDTAVRLFVSDPNQFRIDRESNEWHLNKVLDWFGEDFGGKDGLRKFFSKYVSSGVGEYLLSGAPEIKFDEYDWTLNDTAVFGGSD